MSIPHVRPLRRALAAVAAAGALTFAAAGAAQAESWSHRDAAGDVQRYDFETDSTTTVPDRTVGDVRKVRVVHGSHRVSMKFTMPTAPKSYMYYFTVRTPAGGFDVSRMRVAGQTEVSFTKAGKDKEIPCKGIEWTLHTSTSPASVSVSVPRSCLGDPRWIRAGAAAFSVSSKGMFGDDGVSSEIGDAQALSPKVRRG